MIMFEVESMPLSSCCNGLLWWLYLSNSRIVLLILTYTYAAVGTLVTSVKLGVNISTSNLVLQLWSYNNRWLVHSYLVGWLHTWLVAGLRGVSLGSANTCCCTRSRYEWIVYTLNLSWSLDVWTITALSCSFLYNLLKRWWENNICNLLTCGIWFTILAGCWLLEWTPIDGFL